MAESPSVYLAADRKLALAAGHDLPDRANGAALFADLSGFTALTEMLATELGSQRGADELTRHLNLVYDALVAELDRFGGSVISFSGDAITCWLDGDDGLRATACGLAMQEAVDRFASIRTPSGASVTVGVKVAIAVGQARRFTVGDPELQVMDILAGALLDRLAAAEHHAQRGDVLLDPAAGAMLAGKVALKEVRVDTDGGEVYPVAAALLAPVPVRPWPTLDEDLPVAAVREWLLPEVYERLASGQGEFLSELRPTIALFMQFGGIDYDDDANARARLDEAMRGIQQELARFGGRVMQLTMGDKGSYVCAAFGAPIAHEDDAARAASAAMVLRSLSAGGITGIKIGIAQGRARVGAYGGSNRRTYGVLGDAVNLAARLMQAAEAGQVLAGDLIASATSALFEWRQLPNLKVKGRAAVAFVSALEGWKERQGLRTLIGRYDLPLVGRKAELLAIDERLKEAASGRGQVIGITAEAGMGKSRLVAEAVIKALDRGFAGYGGAAESYGVNTPYLAWHGIWQEFFNVLPSASPDDTLASLTEQLAAVDSSMAGRAPLLGTALNLPLPDNDLTRTFDAKLRKSLLETMLTDLVRARARQQPLLLVLEDCHWLDPLSQDLMEAIGRSIAGLPVALLIAYRVPELEHSRVLPVSRLPHFSEIRLQNFDPPEAEELIRYKLAQMFGAGLAVPAALLSRVTTRSEGNPFYIEELLNYLQDQGVAPTDVNALLQLDLPTSLHRLILARIDRLADSQRTTLRVAAVVGRQFQAMTLWDAVPQIGLAEAVRRDLELLSKLELTKLEWEPELTYVFRHIVTQEVSYESLLYGMRAMLHKQIARYIEEHSGDLPDQYVDLLAYHYDRSDNLEKRREYLMKAGVAAQQSYANASALDYFSRLMPLLDEADRLDVVLRVGQVHELMGDWAAAGEAYHKGLALAADAGDRPTHARCETMIAELSRKQGHYDEAREWLARARQTFDELADEAGVGRVLHASGSIAAQRGDFDGAQEAYEASLVIRRSLDDRAQVAALLSNLGIIARSRGDYETSRRLHQESLTLRRELKDRRAIAVSLNNLGNVALDQADFGQARQYLEEAVGIQREVGDKHYIANALNNLGNVTRAQGDFATSRRLYNESLTLNRELGDSWQLAYLLEDIGALAALEGRAERALTLVAAASTLRDSIRAPLSDTERTKLERLLAPALASLAEPERAGVEAAGRALSLDESCNLAGRWEG